MTTHELVQNYESSWSAKPAIFGVPGGQLSPAEQAGELIKNYGLAAARRIACEKAREFPAAWNHWQRVSDALHSASE